MYLCINNNAGILTGVEVTTSDQCPAADYIAASSTEFSELPTLTDIFRIPVVDDLQSMWMTGFALPIICYLTAWAYQVVIAWFNSNHEQ